MISAVERKCRTNMKYMARHSVLLL